MKKIAILYHSGVGNTKLVANIMKQLLEKQGLFVYMKSIEEKINPQEIEEVDAIIFGFPTYHAEPSTSMKEFIKSNGCLTRDKSYFVFTTCGLYPANSLRIFIKLCNERGLVAVYDNWYRMAATDGTLLAPNFSFFQTFEKNLVENIKRDILHFISLDYLGNKENPKRIPRVKLYSLVNYPNKKLGERLKFKIKVNHSICVGCEKCVMDCPHDCLSMNEGSKIIFDPKSCENCYRCVHGCPVLALSITKRKPKKLLKQGYFNQFFNNIDY